MRISLCTSARHAVICNVVIEDSDSIEHGMCEDATPSSKVDANME
jgi:hypothetical protein